MIIEAVIENPREWLTGGCVIFFLFIILVTLSLLILSSIGFSVCNINMWFAAFASELSFIMKFLMNGNSKNH